MTTDPENQKSPFPRDSAFAQEDARQQQYEQLRLPIGRIEFSEGVKEASDQVQAAKAAAVVAVQHRAAVSELCLDLLEVEAAIEEGSIEAAKTYIANAFTKASALRDRI